MSKLLESLSCIFLNAYISARAAFMVILLIQPKLGMQKCY